MDPQLVDGQMATAFLTGIVSETDRFKNEKTTPEVLAVGSRLMSAGANQQLIAEKLDEPVKSEPLTKIADHDASKDDGALEINHDDDEVGRIHIDDNGNLEAPVEGVGVEEQLDPPSEHTEDVAETQPQEAVYREYIQTPMPPNNAATPSTTVKPASEVEQPSMAPSPLPASNPDAVVNAQQLQGNESDQPQSTPVDAMPEPATEAQMPVMQHGQKVVQPLSEEFQPKKVDNPIGSSATEGSLADLEQKVDSPHAEENSLDAHLGSIRNQVNAVAENALTPNQNIGAQFIDLQPPIPEEVAPVTDAKPEPITSNPGDSQNNDPNGPPAVPPPLMPPSQPQFFDENGKTSNPFSSN
jgi:hypothetical protein